MKVKPAARQIFAEDLFFPRIFEATPALWRQSTTRDGRVGTERTGIARPVGTNVFEERVSLDSSD